MKRSDEHHKCQVAIVDFCRKYPGAEWIFAVPNGDKRNKATAARLKREGVLAGVWDLFLPVCKEQWDGDDSSLWAKFIPYNGLWIEVKVGKDSLSPKQKAFGEYVRSQGYATFETDKVQTTQSAIDAIRAYLRGDFIQGRKY